MASLLRAPLCLLPALFVACTAASGNSSEQGEETTTPGAETGSPSTPVEAGASDDAAADDAVAEDAAVDGDAPTSKDTGVTSDAAPTCVDDTIAPGPLAREGKYGRLVYGPYANQGDTRALNVLPDFSWAGYEGGGVAIPDVPVVETVDAASSGDDRARIQEAIDAVAALPLGASGFRGAVLLRKGTYRLADPLRIRASGVVLRGEGQEKGGTVLLATAAKQYTLIEIAGDSTPLTEVAGSRTRITSAFVPVGARTFTVADAGALPVGARVVVRRTPNQKWIDDLKMGPYGWTPSAYATGHERTVVARKGDEITVDIPIVDAMDTNHGGGEVYAATESGRLRHVGVEDLRLDSTYASETDENHGWSGVSLAGARDSWVRRMTALHFGYSAVTFEDGSAFNTVEDTAHLDPKSLITGGRRYSFNVGGGIGNLFQRCFARGGRHSFVSGSQVTGPNVWLDSLAVDTHADDGPHHRWATGLLFDNTKSDELHVQNRKDAGTGHGWAGAQVLFWNVSAGSLISDAPIGAMNWSVGAVGKFGEGTWAPEAPAGLRELSGATATPRSLYLRQLRDRLGDAAVLATTAPAQRKGRIWTQLATWAGEGKLTLP